MNLTASRRRTWPALLLSLSLLATGGLGAVSLGADAEENEAEAAASEPTPEPTAFPEFDPSTVTVRLDLVSDRFENSVYLADDGAKGPCLYVVEKEGQVWALNPQTNIKNPRPFLDISKVVATGAEQGLHSIAFHPRFRKNGRFFVHYNDATKKGASVVAEFKGRACKPEAKNANNPKPIKRWVDVRKEFPNNNAGWIGFNRKDGKLYVPLGDGGGLPSDPDGLSQDISTPLGKILRIDVDRRDGIAEDNPYVRVVKGKLKPRRGAFRQTWAVGVRDPRRASFDGKTGDFWFGDVGQDRFEQPGWEEVNLVPANSVKRNQDGPNYGWSHVEGADTCHPQNQPDCDPSLYTPPVHSYEVTSGSAVTGGYVYRGKSIPELDGVYVFSDFSDGSIWGLDAEAVYAGHEPTVHRLYDGLEGFVSFGQDDARELYLVTLEGSIYRLGVERR